MARVILSSSHFSSHSFRRTGYTLGRHWAPWYPWLNACAAVIGI